MSHWITAAKAHAKKPIFYAKESPFSAKVGDEIYPLDWSAPITSDITACTISAGTVDSQILNAVCDSAPMVKSLTPHEKMAEALSTLQAAGLFLKQAKVHVHNGSMYQDVTVEFAGSYDPSNELYMEFVDQTHHYFKNGGYHG